MRDKLKMEHHRVGVCGCVLRTQRNLSSTGVVHWSEKRDRGQVTIVLWFVCIVCTDKS